MAANRTRSPEDKQKWRLLWANARRNVGSGTRVRQILGYKTKDPKGRNLGSQHFNSALERGTIPKKRKQQQLLRQLAGPHGRTVAIAWYKVRGIPLPPSLENGWASTLAHHLHP